MPKKNLLEHLTTYERLFVQLGLHLENIGLIVSTLQEQGARLEEIQQKIVDETLAENEFTALLDSRLDEERTPISASVAHRIRISMVAFDQRLRQQQLLGEMCLVYVITLGEAAVADQLRTVLIAYPETLKSQRQLTYEQILEHSTVEEVQEAMAEKEVRRLSHQGWDQLSAYLQDRFNVSLQDHEDWNTITEATERRNAIIHNAGIADRTYCRKTGQGKEGERLETTVSYVEGVGGAVLRVLEFLHQSLIEKMNIKPEFRTLDPSKRLSDVTDGRDSLTLITGPTLEEIRRAGQSTPAKE